MNKKTKKFGIISFFLLSGILCGGYFTVRIIQEIQSKRELIDMMRAQDKRSSEKIAQREVFSHQYDFVRGKEDLLQSVFVNKNDLISTIRVLESLAETLGVSVRLDISDGSTEKQKSKVKTSATKNSETASNNQQKNKILFFLEVRGTYEKTVAYMESLERIRPIASLESVVMKKDDEKYAGSVSASLNQLPIGGALLGLKVITNATVSFVPHIEVKK